MDAWKKFSVEVSRRPAIYYLAYGSNLSLERMAKRCPDTIAAGISKIPGYRLLFKKSGSGFYATIEQDEERQLGEPSMEYYKLLDDGYARWGFDVEILDKGLSDSIGVKAANAYLARFQKL